MPYLVTPQHLARRAELYHQLASLMAAGVSLIAACQVLIKAPPTRSFRPPLKLLVARLEDGSNVTEALRSLGQWMPTFDIALVSAGEQSGRLDQCFRMLGDYYQERASLLRSIIGELLYPVFLLHFAIFLLPLARHFLSGNLAGYFSGVLGILVPLYALLLGLIYVSQSRRAGRLRAIVEKASYAIPLLGSARRELALARLSAALEALISAGVPIVQSWDMAAAACGSLTLEAEVARWRPRVVSEGETPAEVLKKSTVFPNLFASLYATGEISGQLDTTLKRLHHLYLESASRKLHLVASWTPRLVFILVALYIAYSVVNFYSAYFQEINTMIQ